MILRQLYRQGIIERESRTHLAVYYMASTVNDQLLRNRRNKKWRNGMTYAFCAFQNKSNWALSEGPRVSQYNAHITIYDHDFWKPDCAQANWWVLSPYWVSKPLSMMFPIWLSYILEQHVRCQFEPLFSKDFKNHIYFVAAVIFLKK